MVAIFIFYLFGTVTDTVHTDKLKTAIQGIYHSVYTIAGAHLRHPSREALLLK